MHNWESVFGCSPFTFAGQSVWSVLFLYIRRGQIILKRAVGHTPKSKTLDEVYLHSKATQMIEAFDPANQLVKDEVLALPEE